MNRPQICATCCHWGRDAEKEAKAAECRPLVGHVCALASSGVFQAPMAVVPDWADWLLKTDPWHTCGAWKSVEEDAA